MADYGFNLITEVMNNSVSDIWEEAVNEWSIVDCELDEELESRCICGKENIKYLFTITNNYNGNKLKPIGSSCINKFGRRDLKESTDIYQQLYRLLSEFRDSNYIQFSSDLFSRKLIEYLYEDGCFIPNQYNSYDPERDYQFLIDMFNKRSPLSEKQDRKVKALIMGSVRPYLSEKLKIKSNE